MNRGTIASELEAFIQDEAPDGEQTLVAACLAVYSAYAEDQTGTRAPRDVTFRQLMANGYYISPEAWNAMRPSFTEARIRWCEQQTLLAHEAGEAVTVVAPDVGPAVDAMGMAYAPKEAA